MSYSQQRSHSAKYCTSAIVFCIAVHLSLIVSGLFAFIIETVIKVVFDRNSGNNVVYWSKARLVTWKIIGAQKVGCALGAVGLALDSHIGHIDWAEILVSILGASEVTATLTRSQIHPPPPSLSRSHYAMTVEAVALIQVQAIAKRIGVKVSPLFRSPRAALALRLLTWQSKV
jgi:hypothetical protein